MKSFEEEFIAKMASALGLTVDQLTAPFEMTPAERQYQKLRDWYIADSRARWNAAIVNAVWAAYINDDCSIAICGYNPQKLLPSNRRCEMCLVEFDAPFYRDYRNEEDDGEKLYLDRDSLCAPCRVLRNERIARMWDGATKNIIPKWVWGDLDQSDKQDLFIDFEAVQGDRRLAPFVSPRQQGKTITRHFIRDEPDNYPIRINNVRLSYPHLVEKSEWSHKVAVVDIATVEHRMIAELLQREGIRGVIIQAGSAGGEIAGNPQLDLYRQGMWDAPPEPKVAKKGPPSYLKHDPTKKHRRRRK